MSGILGKDVPVYTQKRNPANVIQRAGTPSTAAIDNDLGTLYVDTTNDNIYALVDKTSGTATWAVLGGASTAVATLTGDSGGALSPTSGNINLLGTANQITTTGSGSTITWSLPAALTAPGSVTATTTMTATLGDITATNGDLVLGTAGNKLNIAAGANASVGTATLAAGTIIVSTTAVSSSSIILISRNTPGGTLGNLSVPVASIVDGTEFVINSDSGTETSTVNWLIIN